MIRTSALTGSELPTPEKDTAFVDGNDRIWLFVLDPPSRHGLWRIPGGTLSKAANPVMDAALKKFNVKTLTRLAPVRRRKAS